MMYNLHIYTRIMNLHINYTVLNCSFHTYNILLLTTTTIILVKFFQMNINIFNFSIFLFF